MEQGKLTTCGRYKGPYSLQRTLSCSSRTFDESESCVAETNTKVDVSSNCRAGNHSSVNRRMVILLVK
jgi:hypothetical protein